MSKFTRGDLVTVLVGEPWRTGRVSLTWSNHISERTGIPLVEVILDRPTDTVAVAYFDEDELELDMDKYEFLAVYVDQEDFEQSAIGPDEWGTLEYAERLIQRAKNQEDDPEWKKAKMLQINRRRKVGYTIGYKAYRW